MVVSFEGKATGACAAPSDTLRYLLTRSRGKCLSLPCARYPPTPSLYKDASPLVSALEQYQPFCTKTSYGFLTKSSTHPSFRHSKLLSSLPTTISSPCSRSVLAGNSGYHGMSTPGFVLLSRWWSLRPCTHALPRSSQAGSLWSHRPASSVLR